MLNNNKQILHCDSATYATLKIKTQTQNKLNETMFLSGNWSILQK